MDHVGFMIIVAMVTAGLLVAGTIYSYQKDDQVQPCPCSEARFCERIKDTTRKEVFVFSLFPKQNDWLFYDWDKVTTVVMVGYMDINLVCHAHKYGARAVYIGSVSTDVLPDSSARAAWTQKQLQIVKDNYLDGVNFDYEDAILRNQTDIRQGYTSLVAETKKAFTDYFPYLQVSVDVAWSPACIDSRCYDFTGLAKASDFLFVMAYDEQSQIRGKCVAAANSGYTRTLSGLNEFLEIGVAPDQLVLGVPWYGYRYPCLTFNKNECTIRHVPFRGVNCSDAAGTQINYSVTIQLLKNYTSGQHYDPTTMTPFLNYKANGTTYQVWYDDPKSLTLKYQMALDMHLRGVGMWNAECVNYTSKLPEDIESVKAMWDAFPDYD